MQNELSEEDRIGRQLSQYKFPYHWLPSKSGMGVVAGRAMQWALEYVGYMGAVADEIRKLQVDTVIDIGCGDGRLGEFLSSDAGLKYQGIDISSDAIGFASIFNPAATYSCTRLSDVNDSFDLAVAVEVLEHIPDSELLGFLADIRRILRPGGFFVVSVPTTVRKLHPKHFRHYDESLLLDQLSSAGFSAVRMYRVHRDNMISRACQIALSNRIYSLNSSWLTKFIWSIYSGYCLFASRADGAHLIAIAKASERE